METNNQQFEMWGCWSTTVLYLCITCWELALYGNRKMLQFHVCPLSHRNLYNVWQHWVHITQTYYIHWLDFRTRVQRVQSLNEILIEHAKVKCPLCCVCFCNLAREAVFGVGPRKTRRSSPPLLLSSTSSQHDKWDCTHYTSLISKASQSKVFISAL